MSVVIRGLTLRNPWAHHIAHGAKDIENRTWEPTRGVTHLLIHAGAGWHTPAEGRRFWLDGRPPVVPSAVVAVARLAEVCVASRLSLHALTCDCGDWAQPGQVHWRLADVQPLPEPIPATGRLGLWAPTPELLAAVTAQFPVPGWPS